MMHIKLTMQPTDGFWPRCKPRSCFRISSVGEGIPRSPGRKMPRVAMGCLVVEGMPLLECHCIRGVPRLLICRRK